MKKDFFEVVVYDIIFIVLLAMCCDRSHSFKDDDVSVSITINEINKKI